MSRDIFSWIRLLKYDLRLLNYNSRLLVIES